MRYHVLATDYDGTLAQDGRVDAATVESLRKLLATGRRLVMVTGRELPELLKVSPEIDLFEWVVAENGGLLYQPASNEEKPLADPPSDSFLRALHEKNVGPISVGHIIVATWEPHQEAVLNAIRDKVLELQVIFKKGAVMILPAGGNKASGLIAALKEMDISPDGTLPRELMNVVLITVHPDLLSGALLERVDTVLMVGANAVDMLTDFSRVTKQPAPQMEPMDLEADEFLLWFKESAAPPLRVLAHPCKMARHRHRRKYAEGQLPPDRSIYFQGPQLKMNLRTQNLMLFLQIGDGGDDETWQYHLRKGDYSRWFRECIKDENLAAAAKEVEAKTEVTPKESRALIRALVEQEYTVPASLPLPVAGAS